MFPRLLVGLIRLAGQLRKVDAELFQTPHYHGKRDAREEVAAGIGRERLGELELRIKLGHDPLSDDQHREQEREVTRNPEAAPADDLQDLADRAAQ